MRLKGPRLYLFRPVEDLSALAEDGQHVLAGWGSSSPAAQPLANELEKHVLKSRVGMVLVTHSILKIDQWYKSAAWPGIEGAANFRKIPHWSVYGVAQPTLGGMKNVLQAVSKDVPDLTTLVWINLREEPLIYINGVPYVLRDQYLTLRNTKTFSGITPARLEVIESRLKDDVRQEIAAYEDRVLLHGETEDGKITPVWEDCEATGVHTFKEVIGIVQSEEKDSDVALSSGKIEGDAPTVKKPLHIDYYRVPITAETPPDLVDLDLLLSVISRVSLSDTAIVVNCQIGLGRSTTGTVIVSLILHWLKQTTPEPFALPPTATKPRLNYQVIHSLLRVIRSGLESKRVVDDVIDYCSTSINLRETIEESRRAAEAEVDETQRKRFIKRGILQLKRYFMLILFQNFLDQNPAEVGDRMTHSFSTWYHKHPEFQSIREELEEENLIPLTPVDYLAPGDGVALTTEVLDVVNRRHGAVLAQGTIVKYDYFPGCQKLSLPDKIDGAPNYRRISLNVIRGATAPYRPMSPSHRYSVDELSMPVLAITESQTATSGSFVYGTAMPTKDAIRRVMTRVGGQGTRRILWTSLREEPVIYVNGRPYVLRLFPDPLRNLEATGIARDRVELMEAQMKRDLVAEIKLFNGRVLLHEEQVQGNSFSIVVCFAYIYYCHKISHYVCVSHSGRLSKKKTFKRPWKSTARFKRKAITLSTSDYQSLMSKPQFQTFSISSLSDYSE